MSINEGGASAADELDLYADDASNTSTTVEKEKSEAVSSKYEGKSVEDIIKMHQNAERLIARQGADLAAQRRLSDKILELSPNKSQSEVRQVERSPVTVEQLLNDPDKALQHAVASSDADKRARAAEDRVARLEAKITEKDFVTRHANFREDMQDPEFTTWVQKNELRKALGNEAAKDNFVAAANLWDMWEEHKELVGKVQNRDERPKAKAKVASTVRSTPAENHKGKTFSRAKLMELREKVANGDTAATARWNDPEFQKNMIQAYAEDRVK